MLKSEIIDDVARIDALVPAWRELLARAASPEPVLTPLWLLAWWKQFGDADRRKLRVVTLRDGERLVGIVPLTTRLVLHRRAIPVRRLELLGTGEAEVDEICSDYVGALVEKGEEAAAARALAEAVTRGALGGWDELLMPAMNAEDPFVAELQRALEGAGAAVTVAETGRCPYIPLPKTWDEYLKKLDSSRRYVVTRGMRELEKWVGKDGYSLVRASNAEELAAGRKILHSLHGERWNDSGESGVFTSERFARFHDEVMPKLLDGVDGSLDLLWLVAKGEPVAAIYNIVYNNKVYFYQSGRKIDVPKNVKPGIAIHVLAIKRSIEAGHREYDFLNGASQYKRQLALETRPLVTLRGIAPGIRARAVEAARGLAEKAIARVREARKKREPQKSGEKPAPDAAAPVKAPEDGEAAG